MDDLHQKSKQELIEEIEKLRKENTLDTSTAFDISNVGFDILAQTTSSAILIYKKDCVCYVNQEATELTGYSSEELLKMNFWEVVHPDDREMVKERGLARLRNEKSASRYEFRIQTKTGETRWVDFAASSQTIGENDFIVGVALDITIKKEITEREIAKNSARLILQSALLEISKKDFSTLDSFYRYITESISKQLKIGRTSIWFFNEDQSVLYCEDLFSASLGKHEKENSLDFKNYPKYFKALQENLAIATKNATKHPSTSEFTDDYLIPLNITSMLDIPIRRSGKITGVICCEHIGNERVWSDEEQDFVTAISEIITATIETIHKKDAEAQLTDAYQKLSETHELLITQEQTIEQEREQLEITLRSIGDGVITTDINGCITMINKTTEMLSGWSQNEAIGKKIDSVFNIVNEYTKTPCENPVEKVIKTGNVVGLANHTALISKSGKTYIISDSAAPIKDKKGNITGIVLVFRDNTEQKKVEDQLRESEKQFRTTFENAPIGMCVNQLDGLFIQANHSFSNMLGYSQSELQQLHFIDITHPEDKEASKIFIEEILSDGDNIRHIDKRYVKKDGSIIWATTSVSLLKNSENIPKYFIVQIRDVTEAKLTEEELNLKNLVFESSIAASSISDTKGILLYVNNTFLKTWGYSSKQEVIGLPINQFFESEIEANKILLSLNKTGIYQGEYTAVRKDGTLFIANAQATTLYSKNGEIIGFQSAVIDITDKKNIEEALIKSQQLFQTLANTSPVGIFRADAEGNTTYVNPKWSELSDLSFNEAIGYGWLDAVYYEDKENLKSNWDRLTPLQKTSVAEYRFLKKDGTIIWVMGNAVPEWNKGKVVGYIGTVTDISERKHAEQLIKESEENYRMLLELASDAFFQGDHEGNLIRVNNKALELTGYSKEEILKMNMKELFPSEEIQKKPLMYDKLKQGETLRTERKILRKDGSTLFVEMNSKKMPDGTFQSFFRDITERRKMEDEIQKSEKLYRATFENTGTATIIIEEDLTISSANAQFEELSKHTKEEIEGKLKWTQFVVKEDLERMQKQHQIRREHTEDALNQYEFSFIDNNGKIKRIFLTVDLIPGTKKSVASLLDITDRKREEDILRESEEKYRSLIETTETGYVIIDIQGNVLDANPKYVELAGYKSLNEILNRNVLEWTSEQVKADNKNAVNECATKGFIRNFETEYINSDGKITPVEINATVIKTGKKDIILTLTNDISERKLNEQSLKESEEKFRLLYTSMDQAVTLNEIILDEAGNPVDYRIIEANPGFEKHTSLKVKDILGKSILQFLPQTEKFWIERFGETAITGKQQRIENYSKELKRYYDFYIYSPKKGQFALISTDITDKKKEEKQKELNEARLEAVLKLNNMSLETVIKISDFALESAVKITDSKLGYLAFVNHDETVIHMHSWSKQTMKECNISDIKFDFEVGKTGLCGEAILQRKPIITNNYSESNSLKKGLPEGHVEIKNHLNVPIFDGDKIVLLIGVSNKSYDYDESDINQLKMLLNSMWRIIERKKTEEALTESEQRYRLVTENSKDIISKFNNKGKITFVSNACLNLLGYEPNELINKSVFSLLHSDDFTTLKKLLFNTYTPDLIKHQIRKKNGDYIWVETNIKIIFETDSIFIKEIVAVSRDITEIMKTEEFRQAKEVAEYANKAKTEFLANMSHEIRNPMNAIIGLTNTLDRMEVDPSKRIFVQSLKTSSTALLNILNDILDFSKIEANKAVLFESVFSLDTIIDEVFTIFKLSANEKDVAFNFIKKPDVPSTLFGDSIKLRQILINLCSNALKFTDTGSVTMNISLLNFADETAQIKFEVIDTGIGIEEKDFAKLFSSFTQLDSTTTKAYSGTGLGLTIVKNYTEMMHGKVRVSSNPNEGSNFTLEIPFKVAKEEKKKAEVKLAKNTKKMKLKILLAEDDGINQMYLKSFLNEQGWEVDTAFNGIQVLEKFDLKKYDIILMDGQMPKMDGFEATRKIRIKEQESNTHTPILAITGYAVSGDKEKFLESGMDDYISKPVNEALLIETILKYV